jgi:phosphatidylserine/phosphatidylglycerophosphate/cardiolipin synthase-like enzyme
VTPMLRGLEEKYLAADGAPFVRIHSSDTQVEPLVDGKAYLGAVHTEISATGPGDSVFHSGLLLEPDVDLLGRSPSDQQYQSLEQLLVERADAGVDIRVLLAYGVVTGGLPFLSRFTPFRGNALAAHRLRRLNSAVAEPRKPLAANILLDWSGGLIGSNHQKFTVVRRAGRTSAWLGGIDLAQNRVDGPPHDTLRLNGDRWGWHDGGIRLHGPGADGVWDLFAMRWREVSGLAKRVYWIPPLGFHRVNPSHPAPEPGKAMRSDSVPSPGRSVQLLRSFGPWKVDSVLFWQRRRWTELPKNGVQEIFATLVKAIGAARRYIYLEDQYFSEMLGGKSAYELFPHLRAAAARGIKVVFVGSGTRDPADNSVGAINRTLPSDVKRKIVDKLPPATRRNVVMYRVENLTVHTKVVLIDDEFATIGSANMFSRSMWGTDHELTAAVVADDHLVRDLRVWLWSEHLRVDPLPPALRAALEDVDIGLGIWRPEWLPAGMPDGTWQANGQPPGFEPRERVLALVGPG